MQLRVGIALCPPSQNPLSSSRSKGSHEAPPMQRWEAPFSRWGKGSLRAGSEEPDGEEEEEDFLRAGMQSSDPFVRREGSLPILQTRKVRPREHLEGEKRLGSLASFPCLEGAGLGEGHPVVAPAGRKHSSLMPAG